MALWMTPIGFLGVSWVFWLVEGTFCHTIPVSPNCVAKGAPTIDLQKPKRLQLSARPIPCTVQVWSSRFVPSEFDCQRIAGPGPKSKNYINKTVITCKVECSVWNALSEHRVSDSRLTTLIMWMDANMVHLPAPIGWAQPQKVAEMATGRTQRALMAAGCRWGIIHILYIYI